MIVHPGSNVGAVLNVSLALVGGLSISNYPAPGDSVSGLSENPSLSPTVAQLNS